MRGKRCSVLGGSALAYLLREKGQAEAALEHYWNADHSIRSALERSPHHLTLRWQLARNQSESARPLLALGRAREAYALLAEARRFLEELVSLSEVDFQSRRARAATLSYQAQAAHQLPMPAWKICSLSRMAAEQIAEAGRLDPLNAKVRDEIRLIQNNTRATGCSASLLAQVR